MAIGPKSMNEIQGRHVKNKDSEQLLKVIRKMFVIGDESKLGGSEMIEPSLAY
jgi:hypothetical protein